MIWISLPQGTFYFSSEDFPDSHATLTVLLSSQPLSLAHVAFPSGFLWQFKSLRRIVGWPGPHEIRPLDMFQELSLFHSLFTWKSRKSRSRVLSFQVTCPVASKPSWPGWGNGPRSRSRVTALGAHCVHSQCCPKPWPWACLSAQLLCFEIRFLGKWCILKIPSKGVQRGNLN